MVDTQQWLLKDFFLVTDTGDCGISEISTSIFKPVGLDCHAIIFNKEALLDNLFATDMSCLSQL